MVRLPSVVATVLLGLLLAMTQAPANADHEFSAPQALPTPPMAGELFVLNGQVPVQNGQPRLVHLQRHEGGQWRTVRSRQSSGDGSYSIPERINVATWFRVAVGTSGGLGPAQSHTVKVQVAPQYVAASVKRICSNENVCGNQAEVAGYVRPTRDQRLVTLQYKSGSTWKSTSVQGRTDSAGRFAMTFSIAGWSQWSAKQLRVAAGSHAGSAYAVSAPMSFMPGPTRIGRNVLRVDVSGGAFPQTKGVDYTGTATLSRDGQVLIDRARLDKFSVRGSSTANFAKKPYNMRFENKPAVDVFGMKADTSWTLLAMFVDQSFVRDKTALDLGRKLVATGQGMTWNPASEYVEMFVNSEYKGAYLLTEKVKIDGDRVNVGKNTGMIMEVDGRNVSDPTLGFRAPHGLVFAFKEPDHYDRNPNGTYDSEGVTPGKLSAIRSKVSSVESYLYTTNRQYWHKVIDPVSAVDFYLHMEFLKDNDSDFWRSKYFTWDSAKTCGNTLCDTRLHFGPVWDFDRGAGNQTGTSPGATYVRSPIGWNANGKGIGYDDRATYTTHWYVQMWKIPAFRSLLKSRWEQVRAEFWRAAKYEVANNKALIGWGAANDRRRWAHEPKWYKPKGSTYDAEVAYVSNWFLQRFGWMDRQL